jgi:3-dehydroquinate dehydratase-1
MDLGATFIDVELEAETAYLERLISRARQSNTGVIISYHNFNETPERSEMTEKIQLCYDRGGDIAKLATQVNSLKDVKNLISMYDLPGKKVVVGMGEEGRITRVLAPYLGAEFTFAAAGEGGETAPGQLTVTQLNEIYKMINAS